MELRSREIRENKLSMLMQFVNDKLDQFGRKGDPVPFFDFS